MLSIRGTRFWIQVAPALLWALSCLPVQAADLAVVAAAPRGTALEEITVRLRNENSTRKYFLRNVSSEPIKDVRIVARFDPGSADAEAARVQIKRENTVFAEQPGTLAADQEIAFDLAFSTIPLGRLTGYLALLDANGQTTRLAALSVEHTPAASLKIQGAQNKALSLNVDTAQLDTSLRIESMNVTPVEDLVVTVTPLKGPHGQSIPLTAKLLGAALDGKPRTVPPAAELALSARLPELGTYTGSVFLQYGHQRHETVLTVTYAKGDQPYEILAVPAVQADISPCGSTLEVRLTVRELRGANYSGTLPTLDGLALKTPSKPAMQTARGEVEWRDADGKKLTTLDLKAEETLDLRMLVPGVSQAGEHEGGLLVKESKGQPVKVTLLARHNFVLAWITIGLGLGVSWWLRRYQKEAQSVEQNLARQRLIRSLMALQPSLAGDRDAADILEKQLAGLSALPLADADAAERSREKVNLIPLWCRARSAVALLRSPAEQRSFQNRLTQVREGLSTAGGTAEDLTRLETELKAILQEAAQALNTSLVAAIDQAEAGLQALWTAPSVTGPVSETTRQKLQTLHGKLHDLREKIPDAASTPGVLVEIDQTLDAASREALRVSLEGFQAELSRAAPWKFAKAEEEWKGFKNVAQQHVDEALAVLNHDLRGSTREFWEAQRAMLRGAVALLKTKLALTLAEVEQALKAAKEAGQESATLQKLIDDLGAIQAALPDLSSRLEQAGDIEGVSAEKLQAVFREYKGLADRFVPLNQEWETGQGRLDSKAVAATRWVAQLPSVAVPAPPPAVALPAPVSISVKPESVEELEARLWWLQTLYQALIIVIALLTGWQLLWVDNFTWGGVKDYLLAFFWGLGSHSVGSNLESSVLQSRLNPFTWK